jgi:hypothetical protein
MQTSSLRKSPKKGIPVKVIHVCTQEEKIEKLIKNTDKLSIIITGNGTPEEGYVYKLNMMGNTVNQINEKLTGISGIVKELHEESIGKKASGKTEKEIKTEKRTVIAMWIKALSFLIVALGFAFTVYFNFTNGKEVKDTVKREIRMQEGVSKVTRGGYVKYNIQGISDSVKLVK